MCTSCMWIVQYKENCKVLKKEDIKAQVLLSLCLRVYRVGAIKENIPPALLLLIKIYIGGEVTWKCICHTWWGLLKESGKEHNWKTRVIYLNRACWCPVANILRFSCLLNNLKLLEINTNDYFCICILFLKVGE